jgi:hypothetical protein
MRTWLVDLIADAVRQAQKVAPAAQPLNALVIKHDPGCGENISRFCLGIPGPQGVQVLAPMACPFCGVAMFTASPVVRPNPNGPKVEAARR